MSSDLQFVGLKRFAKSYKCMGIIFVDTVEIAGCLLLSKLSSLDWVSATLLVITLGVGGLAVWPAQSPAVTNTISVRFTDCPNRIADRART